MSRPLAELYSIDREGFLLYRVIPNKIIWYWARQHPLNSNLRMSSISYIGQPGWLSTRTLSLPWLGCACDDSHHQALDGVGNNTPPSGDQIKIALAWKASIAECQIGSHIYHNILFHIFLCHFYTTHKHFSSLIKKLMGICFLNLFSFTNPETNLVVFKSFITYSLLFLLLVLTLRAFYINSGYMCMSNKSETVLIIHTWRCCWKCSVNNVVECVQI